MTNPSGPAPDPIEEPPRGRSSRRNPWWIPPFLGRVPAVPDAKIQMLGVIALAYLFENFDQATITTALKQIAEGFAVPEAELGGVLSRVHLGSVFAFVLVPFADRIGRRRLFLFSLVGLSLTTFLSAFAQSIEQLVWLQMLGRAFVVTCSATAFVIVSEEFPAEHRGWGIGIVGAVGAFGYGLSLLLFSVIEWLPFGWRSLYALGALPLLMLPFLRRRIRETARFEAHRRTRIDSPLGGGWWRPLASLVAAYPGRTISVGAIGFLASAGQTAGFSFAAFHAQSVHGWSPGQYALMAILAGMVGIIGHPWAGRVADRRGRKAVGFALMASYPLLALAFYHGPAWAMPLAWVPLVFTLTGTGTIERALATELFPTSYRGTASGWLQLTEALGRTGGLAVVGFFAAHGESNVPMISLVVFGSALAALVVLTIPETGRRELEDISEEVETPA